TVGDPAPLQSRCSRWPPTQTCIPGAGGRSARIGDGTACVAGSSRNGSSTSTRSSRVAADDRHCPASDTVRLPSCGDLARDRRNVVRLRELPAFRIGDLRRNDAILPGGKVEAKAGVLTNGEAGFGLENLFSFEAHRDLLDELRRRVQVCDLVFLQATGIRMANHQLRKRCRASLDLAGILFRPLITNQELHPAKLLSRRLQV